MKTTRWAWAEVDLAAIAHNVEMIRRLVHPSDVWAVVKADGYGHGAVQAARAALAAGAAGLCVALVQEGAELRAAAIDAPILLLSQQPHEQADEIVRHRLTATIYTPDAIASLAAAARRAGSVVDVHLKVDTGMSRVGAQPVDVIDLVDAIASTDGLQLAGLFTHLAAADEPGHEATPEQLGRFAAVRAQLGAERLAGVAMHAVNSAGSILLPADRHDLVRLGIAMYGIVPGPGLLDDPASLAASICGALRPALTLHARVGHVKVVAAGAGVSYGLRYRAAGPRLIATVPVGYADGVPRRLSAGGAEVLLGGRRVPIVGVVTMDQLMLDCGAAESPVVDAQVGDRVVLLGRQGDDEVRAEEWAERLGTIGYEVVCGISKRIERVYI